MGAEPRATISIDAYKGYSVAQLKQRCRELCGALMNYEMIILALASDRKLSAEQRAKVDRLIKGYED